MPLAQLRLACAEIEGWRLEDVEGDSLPFHLSDPDGKMKRWATRDDQFFNRCGMPDYTKDLSSATRVAELLEPTTTKSGVDWLSIIKWRESTGEWKWAAWFHGYDKAMRCGDPAEAVCRAILLAVYAEENEVKIKSPAKK